MDKRALIIGGIAICIIMIFVYSYFIVRPTVEISCKEGKVIGFSKEGFPMAEVVPLPVGCSGRIIVKDYIGNVICNVTDKSDNPERISIDCGDLKKHKKENVTIDFVTNSSDYGYKQGQEELLYGR